MQPQASTSPKFSIPSTKAFILCVVLGIAAVATYVDRSKLQDIGLFPRLEEEVPTKIGNWVALANPAGQMTLTTGAETNINQPCDQTVMRSYSGGKGHTVAMVLAWGKQQRQEVNIHKPKLCYKVQSHSVKSLVNVTFPAASSDNMPIIGKRMIDTNKNGQMELVSYWSRIGNACIDNASRARLQIMRGGLVGRMTDGILVRVSQRLSKSSSADIESTFARQEAFIAQLINNVPPGTRLLLAR